MRTPTLLAASILPALIAPGVTLASAPPIFDDRPYAEARQAALDEGKLFIVDFTAEWCMPCKQMDRTTWIDPEVVAWIEANAIAVQIDVDHEKRIAIDYQVRAMPTIVAVVDGEEFDRVIGLKKPDQLIEWLDGIDTGERAIDGIEAAAKADPNDVDARYNLARNLLQQGQFDRATEEYAWLWENMLEHKPAMYGVRLSFMASEVERVIRAHPPARDRFAKIRDETEQTLTGADKTLETLVDFVALNEMLGEQARTLAWYDGAKDDPRNQKAIEKIAGDLEPLLLAEGRWADLGRMLPDPAQAARAAVERFDFTMRSAGDIPKEIRAEYLRSRSDELRTQLAAYHASALAAQRDEPAHEVAAIALRRFDDAPMRLALVGTALDANAARPAHRAMLDAAEREGTGVDAMRSRLDQALASSGSDDDQVRGPEATFGDIAWLAGSWHATDDDGTWDEVWLRPSGNCMSGTLRHVTNGEVTLYELISIERSTAPDGSPRFEMLLRHFSAGLVPWASEADGPMRLALNEAKPGRLVWSSDHVQVIYERDDAGSAMTATVQVADDAAQWQTKVQLKFERR